MAKKYISTKEASDLIGCSKNHVFKLFRRGTIGYKEAKWGERTIYKIRRQDALRYAEENRDNKRIGRELMCREYCRQPIISKGYVLIYKPDHRKANPDGYVPEHILVMETYLGRKLKRKETVHHIDRVRTNNDITNLILYNSRSEHMRFHGKLKKAFLKAQGSPALEEAVIKLVSRFK